MTTTANQQQPAPTAGKKRKFKAKRLLEQIEVRELSFVSRPAIDEDFTLVKRLDGAPPQQPTPAPSPPSPASDLLRRAGAIYARQKMEQRRQSAAAMLDSLPPGERQRMADGMVRLNDRLREVAADVATLRVRIALEAAKRSLHAAQASCAGSVGR